MKIRFISFCLVAMLIFAWSCKPSEKNYRAAYEIAKLKDREGVDSLTYAMMEAEKLPRWRYAGGDSVRVRTLHVKPYMPDSAVVTMKRYNVALGNYGMTANALGHRDRLRASGENAFILSAPGDTYYVVSAQFDSIPQAARYVRRLEFSGVKAVGMPCITVIEPVGFR